eukprot:gnl/TRDRNA2_/TRDRNA2_176084_c0_seq1.p1 gnl/TRDRNA2_/TRDRNA2_176084_c0~~gnl/TRDRNA2_/TRDRNA2_176084_c0_seq1.p1  ORF type:complete len:421 (+),score=-28.49 gnl/TRDRNA2_/TRDRNA2_176084_c0_seq1:153-1415(+)
MTTIINDLNGKLQKVLLRYSAETIKAKSHYNVESLIRSIIQKHKPDNNFYICDLGQVIRCYSAWRRSLPRIVPFYAVKCHPNPAIISTLASIGSGFDCASPAEIDLVVGLGIHPMRIIYANPCKKISDLRYARKLGVQIGTFDTISELDKVATNYPEMLMIIRIRADDPNARCQLGNKFGAEKEIWEELLIAAKYRGIRVVGASFHVGSGATSTEAFINALISVRILFTIAMDIGFELKLLNIGGGFTAFLSEQGYASLGHTSTAITQTMTQLFPETFGHTVISEPGRFLVEKTCTMISQIFGRRPKRSLDKAEDNMDYWIADGLYGSMNCVMYDHASLKPFPIIIKTNSKTQSCLEYISTLFGPTCDGLDTVIRDIKLPLMSNGDWIGFHDMGAYTICGAANFNGIKVSSVKTWYIYSE